MPEGNSQNGPSPSGHPQNGLFPSGHPQNGSFPNVHPQNCLIPNGHPQNGPLPNGLLQNGHRNFTSKHYQQVEASVSAGTSQPSCSGLQSASSSSSQLPYAPGPSEPYQPELDASQNPFYYHVNEMLYRATQERHKRHGCPPPTWDMDDEDDL